jgi:hypothetical protein
MRLIPRHRNGNRGKAPRIEISQAEITADLLYPATNRTARRQAGSARRGSTR